MKNLLHLLLSIFYIKMGTDLSRYLNSNMNTSFKRVLKMKFSFYYRNKNQNLSVDDVLNTLKDLISTSKYIKFIGSRESFNTLKLLIALDPDLNLYTIQYRNSDINGPIILVEHYG